MCGIAGIFATAPIPELQEKIDAMLEVQRHRGPDYSKSECHSNQVALGPTSPFRTAQHIREALALFDEECEMVVSVKETKANPYYVLMEEDEDGWLVKSKEGDFTRRQDCPKVWELNGAVYVMSARVLKSKHISEFTKLRKIEMNTLNSQDLDTMLDWKIAELILDKIKMEQKL